MDEFKIIIQNPDDLFNRIGGTKSLKITFTVNDLI